MWLRAWVLAARHSLNYLKAVLFDKKTTYETALHRLKLCNTCEYLNPITSQCEKCFCFVEEKVQYASETCPERKW